MYTRGVVLNRSDRDPGFPLISPRGRPRVIAEGLCNVEGPVVGPGGWVLNVCSLSRPSEDWATRGGDITATHPTRPLETRVLLNTSTAAAEGIPAALAFGPDGCLYVTDEGRRAIVRVQPDGIQADFISEWHGQRINGPNDLSFDESGNLYFTDPWTSSPENPVGAVYAYLWQTGELRRIDSGMAFPNGIVITEGRLYVAETYTGKVWLYNVDTPGQTTHKREFCSLPARDIETIHGPDGMAFDREGNLYVAYYDGGGVFVFSDRGDPIGQIATEGHKPTNVCFGGEHHDRLYVTVDDLGELVEYDLGVQGQTLNFCPSQISQHPWATVLGSS